MVYIDEHISDFNLSAALLSVSEQRRSQALCFKYELGQRQCVLAYLLLKRALLQEYGISGNPLFTYGPHGKPFLADHPDIHFSLSHCRHAVACAVSSHPVGIDVESIRHYDPSLVRYTMSADEQQAIDRSPRPDAAFIRLWTMKEARLKLTGEGISNHLQAVLSDSDRYRFTTTERLDLGYICTLCEEAAE